MTCLQWSDDNQWLISGHMNGEVRFWQKQDFIVQPSEADAGANDSFFEGAGGDQRVKFGKVAKEAVEKRHQGSKLKCSSFFLVLRGALTEHAQQITSLSLSGTYLVSGSKDGSILIWHLDFLLPTPNMAMFSDVRLW